MSHATSKGESFFLGSSAAGLTRSVVTLLVVFARLPLLTLGEGSRPCGSRNPRLRAHDRRCLPADHRFRI